MQRRYMTAQAGRQAAALTCYRRPMRVSVLQELLALKPWVTVILASAPLATFAEVKSFESWVDAVPDAHIKEWKAQPGNFQLMTKQGGEWGGARPHSSGHRHGHRQPAGKFISSGWLCTATRCL